MDSAADPLSIPWDFEDPLVVRREAAVVESVFEYAADPLSTLDDDEVVAVVLLDEPDVLLDVPAGGASVCFLLTTIPHRGAPFAYLPMATRLGVDSGGD